jgi:hypothetical protein
MKLPNSSSNSSFRLTFVAPEPSSSSQIPSPSRFRLPYFSLPPFMAKSRRSPLSRAIWSQTSRPPFVRGQAVSERSFGSSTEVKRTFFFIGASEVPQKSIQSSANRFETNPIRSLSCPRSYGFLLECGKPFHFCE